MALFEKLERSPFAVTLAFLFFAVLVSATGWRTYRNYAPPSREFDWNNRGLSDFHNGTYYPSLAFREGVVPYAKEAEERYPLARVTPPYHPFVFILHQPFTVFDVKTADVLFFVYNVLLTVLLALLSIKLAGARLSWFAVFFFSGLLMFSRPGHITVFTGYFTLELVLGTVVAVYFAEKRPWLSGVGILLSAGKPTFVIPLIILMACRRNWRALTWGLSLAVVFGIGGLLWLASFSDFSTVLNGIVEGQEALHDDETEWPINTWTRTDAVAMVAKCFDWRPDDKIALACMLGLLAVPGIWLWRRSGLSATMGSQQSGKARPNHPASQSLVADPTHLVIMLSILTSIYHHSYDCLLLFVPWAGLLFYGTLDKHLSHITRIVSGILIGFIWLNYFSTQSVRGILGLEQSDLVWQLITVLNGLCILAVLILVIVDSRDVQTKQT